MIAVDSSALIAMLRSEPEAEAFRDVLLASPRAFISTATQLETFVSRWRRAGPEAAQEALDLMLELRLVAVPFDEALLQSATEGFARWGRGRGRANLN